MDDDPILSTLFLLEGGHRLDKNGGMRYIFALFATAHPPNVGAVAISHRHSTPPSLVLWRNLFIQKTANIAPIGVFLL
jgi:hypothetical protein